MPEDSYRTPKKTKIGFVEKMNARRVQFKDDYEEPEITQEMLFGDNNSKEEKKTEDTSN